MSFNTGSSSTSKAQFMGKKKRKKERKKGKKYAIYVGSCIFYSECGMQISSEKYVFAVK